jgi:LmbE family N-acetylglucosaminyl deacetylase
VNAAPFIAPSSVLTVMAHPDDAELWAGGMLVRCADSGAAVTVAVPHHAEPVRDAEAAAGAAIVGATLYQYDQPTGAAVRELLLAVRPEIVITHPLRDVHPDHRTLAETLVAAVPDVVIATGHPRRVYTADTYNGLAFPRTHHRRHHRYLCHQTARSRRPQLPADRRPLRADGRDARAPLRRPDRHAVWGELHPATPPRSPARSVGLVSAQPQRPIAGAIVNCLLRMLRDL